MFKDDIQRTIYNIGILPLLKIAPRYRRRRSVGCTRNYIPYTMYTIGILPPHDIAPI